MTQTRYLTVSDLINELNALRSPSARVNVTVDVEGSFVAGHGDIRSSATFDGPAEIVEKVFVSEEGPAVRIIARHGVKL